jgi:hypothetical protein
MKDNDHQDKKSTTKEVRGGMRFYQSHWANANAQDRIALIALFNFFAVVITLVILLLNLNSVSRQIRLTQVLNQPYCAVKELKVIKASGNKTINPADVFKISLTIKNFGNYVAKKMSIQYKTFKVTNLKGPNSVIQYIADSEKQFENITALPQHEFEHLVGYYSRENLNSLIAGYEKGLLLRAVITYQNEMSGKTDQFAISYIVTKLLGQEDIYEVMIYDTSKVEGL